MTNAPSVEPVRETTEAPRSLLDLIADAEAATDGMPKRGKFLAGSQEHFESVNAAYQRRDDRIAELELASRRLKVLEDARERGDITITITAQLDEGFTELFTSPTSCADWLISQEEAEKK